MKTMSWKKIGSPSVYFPAVILFGFLTAVLTINNEFYLNLLFMLFSLAGLSGAWNILGGYAGQISLGHSAFYGVAAYTCAILFTKLGVPPIVGMGVSVGAAVILALIIGYPCLRLKGAFFTLATLAIAEVLQLLAVYLRELTAGSEGLSIPYQPSWFNLIFESKNAYALVAFGYMILVLGVTLVFERVKLGYQITALRDDDQAAESLGVDTARAKIVVLVISGVLTAIGAVIVSQYVLFLEPHSDFSINLSVELALMPMVGGLGTAAGPIIGACILVPLSELLRAYVGGTIQGLNYVIYGALLILVVIFMPYGIKALVEKKYQQLVDSLPEFWSARDHETDTRSLRIRCLENTERRLFGVPANPTPNDAPLLRVSQVDKWFGGLCVLREVSFEVYPGEILGVIGPNGAGKTTLFNIISCIYPPSRGKVFFAEHDLTRIRRPHEVSRLGIGRTHQLVKPFGNMSVLENVMVGGFCHQRSSAIARRTALEVLDLVGLTGKQDLPASSLTLANMKRLEMARALATNPKLLLLDEVMAGLNPAEIEEAINLILRIRDKGVTVIVVEHVIKAIMSLSERILVLAQGAKLMEGHPEEVLTDQKVISAYLGEGFEFA